MTDSRGSSTEPAPRSTRRSNGPRDVAIVFLGDAYVVGVGDPKGMGWVTRVVGRSTHPDLALTVYNLGVRGDTTAGVLKRWSDEAQSRWQGREEHRLVISVGTVDVRRGVTMARHRLTLANVLDEAISRGVQPFVVSPPPSCNPEVDDQLWQVVDAQSDVCARRAVPFVDCFSPLVSHEQWHTDMQTGVEPGTPGQAGYGLIAWLVLHRGWSDWLGIA